MIDSPGNLHQGTKSYICTYLDNISEVTSEAPDSTTMIFERAAMSTMMQEQSMDEDPPNMR